MDKARLTREGLINPSTITPGDMVIQNQFQEGPGVVYAPYIPIVCKVPPEMKPVMVTVMRHIAAIEKQHQVTVIYACESGSRAWGFPSADSDYDVRFLYVHHPSWYLNLNDQRDVIEGKSFEHTPEDDDVPDLDVSGWDIKKALTLLHKSNPPLLEWLGSPIIYYEPPQFKTITAMRKVAQETYNTTACIYHYLHMAQNNFREFLKGGEVWVKKYFYVLRPLLAIKWLEAGKGVMPTDFGVLVNDLTEGKLKDEIYKLIEVKKGGAELSWGPRIPTISDFVEDELRRLERKGEYPTKAPSWNALNGIFKSAIVECQPKDDSDS